MDYEYRYILNGKVYSAFRNVPNDEVALLFVEKTCQKATWWLLMYGDRVISMS